jgi:hypothetical protein
MMRHKVSGFREQGTGNKEFKLAYLIILGNAISFDKTIVFRGNKEITWV